MADETPAVQARTPDSPTALSRALRALDIIGCAVAWVVHAFLGVVAYFMAGLGVFSTADCTAGVECGGDGWITAAIVFSIVASLALLVANGTWMSRTIARGRTGIGVGLCFLVAQVVVCLLSLRIASIAGPG